MKRKAISTPALVRRCAELGVTVSTAESCTGGLIAKLLTDIPGSSAVFLGGCITYTNEIKEQLLGVDRRLIGQHTEVSHACAKAMAQGIRSKLGTTLSLSTTGFAGPGGGNEADPVGTVYIGVDTPNGTYSERLSLPQEWSRSAIRNAAARHALALLAKAIEQEL